MDIAKQYCAALLQYQIRRLHGAGERSQEPADITERSRPGLKSVARADDLHRLSRSPSMETFSPSCIRIPTGEHAATSDFHPRRDERRSTCVRGS